MLRATPPRPLAPLLLLAAASGAHALGVGDPAPVLSPETVVKGRLVDPRRGLHVIEFWGTWCEPCKKAIPFLNALARRYRGKVEVTGVSIGGRTAEPLARVRSFVRAKGKGMDYNVVWDGGTGTVYETWGKAEGQLVVPRSFLVRDGVILWIGHPTAGLDEAVARAVAGTYDLPAEKARYDAEVAKSRDFSRRRVEVADALKPWKERYAAGDFRGALRRLDELETARPDLTYDFVVVQARFSTALHLGEAEAMAFARRAVGDPLVPVDSLATCAWIILDPEGTPSSRPYAVALVLAREAVARSKTEDASNLDTYALALFRTGDAKGAITAQRRAIAAAERPGAGYDAATIAELKARLKEFEKGA